MKPYLAPVWLPGGHAQTIYPLLIKPQPYPYFRERWETPDDDFIDLDWNATTGLPLLGVACAMAQDEILERFLEECGLSTQKRLAWAEGISHLREDSRFDEHVRTVRRLLDSAQLSIESLRSRNVAWLRAALADRDSARRAFGQPLAPPSAPGNILPRPAILDRIRGHILGVGDGSPLFVTGNEGVGKSWAVLQSWLSCTDPPALFYLTPDAFVGIPIDDSIQVLARAIGRQCGEADVLAETPRWQRNRCLTGGHAASPHRQTPEAGCRWAIRGR